MEASVQDKPEIPHIDVSIEYKGQKVAHHGAQFMEAIKFLVMAEESIRRDRKIHEPVDTMTEAIQRANLNKLLNGMG